MRNQPLLMLAGIVGLVLAWPAFAAEPVGGKMKAHGAAPCCAVTAIDAAKSVATLKDLKTGKTFQVRVRDKAKLKALKLGQQVDRNL